MTDQHVAYLQSPDYQRDLEATKYIWSETNVLGIAGIFMFLSYLTIPCLTKVQPVKAPSRFYAMKIGPEGEREKLFLLRLLGLSQENGWEGGIRNNRVRDMVIHLAYHHFQFPMMQPVFIEYFAGITAISPLRVYALYGTTPQADIVTGYWTYMRHALALLGGTLISPTTTESSCEEFICKYTSANTAGYTLLRVLLEAYPEYIDLALPVLFAQTRSVVTFMLEEYHAHHS